MRSEGETVVAGQLTRWTGRHSADPLPRYNCSVSIFVGYKTVRKVEKEPDFAVGTDAPP